MAGAFLVGRLVFGAYLVLNGLNHLMALTTMAQFAAARGVPFPEVAVAGSGLLILLGGISILLGWHPELGCAAVVIFLIGVSIPMHAFWADTDPKMRMDDLAHFTENMALAATTLMLVAIPRPWPYSLEARGRIAA